MTPQEHITEAERLIMHLARVSRTLDPEPLVKGDQATTNTIALAQVHATLGKS
jgi:hypothetical protein